MLELMPDKKKTTRTARPSGGKPRYVVGIDTGGTYTDGVLLDYKTRKVLSSSKTLTTREDLTKGIKKVLSELNIDSPSRVRLVGISSTLATNSIAEGKARETGLILIGYDRELVESYELESKFSTRTFEYFKGGHNAQGEEKEKLDTEYITAWAKKHCDEVEAIAISSYFSPLNPTHEERAYKAVRKVCDLPIVLSHQLSTKLDSIKRATTASLNASLVAVMSEFIEAVRASLKEHKIKAPLMIVKGDGSLMPYTDAVKKPVETVLSGPAASAIGGRFLTGRSDAVMVDVGGTTTDIALISDGLVEVSDSGARVGEVETAVKAASIRTACIGCDSRILATQGGDITVGPDRVMPLARIAHQYERVEKEIMNLDRKRSNTWTHTDIEYWLLHRDVSPDEIDEDNLPLKKVVEILKSGPQSLSRVMKKAGVNHPVQLRAGPLLRNGVIEKAALTPTDLLHAIDKMDNRSKPAAKQAVKVFCKLTRKSKKKFPREMLDRIVAMMAEETLVFLARQSGTPDLPGNVDQEWGKWLFDRSIAGDNRLLNVTIESRYPIIGIGAPAGYFVERVSDALKAHFILPEYAEVANAVGAVAGSIMVSKEALLYVQEKADSRAYVVQVDHERRIFKEEEEARRFAEKKVTETATKSASRAGATNPQVEVYNTVEGSLTRIKAWAIGNPELSETTEVAEA